MKFKKIQVLVQILWIVLVGIPVLSLAQVPNPLVCLSQINPKTAKTTKTKTGHPIRLSSIEKAQLGKPIIGKKGKPLKYRYATGSEWKKLRSLLVAQSLKSNPLLDPNLTAYTPGETLALLKAPQVKNWHRTFRKFKVPKAYPIIAFVPCAKTKPWNNATHGLYASYNDLRSQVRAGQLPPVYFVTISEPLGVVPEEFWGTFPQYDNPGLFKSNVMRTSLLHTDWEKTEFGKVLVTPFDEKAYTQAIRHLAQVIADFMRTNGDKTFVSFVEDFNGKSTHSDMLDHASRLSPGLLLPGHRYLKREKPRTPPRDYLAEILSRLPRLNSRITKK